jgi:hypothetical protein
MESAVMKRVGSFLAALLLTMVPLIAQWLNYPTPGIPRTADGKPDLSAPTPRQPMASRTSPEYGRPSRRR